MLFKSRNVCRNPCWRLENKEFIAKAPSEIIEKNQDRLREIKEIHVRYEQALKSFV